MEIVIPCLIQGRSGIETELMMGLSYHAKAKGTVISMKSFVRMGTTQVIILKVRQVPDSVQSSKKWVEHGLKFVHRLVPVLQSRLALIAFYTAFTRIARDTGAALHRLNLFRPFRSQYSSRATQPTGCHNCRLGCEWNGECCIRYRALHSSDLSKCHTFFRGRVAALIRIHMNGLIPFQRTVEETTKAVPLATKQQQLLTSKKRITCLRELLDFWTKSPGKYTLHNRHKTNPYHASNPAFLKFTATNFCH